MRDNATLNINVYNNNNNTTTTTTTNNNNNNVKMTSKQITAHNVVSDVNVQVNKK